MTSRINHGLRAVLTLAFFVASAPGMAAESGSTSAKPAVAADGPACEGYGPQTPRDIDKVAGENKRIFTVASKYTDLNLCNIHFHTNAEHKAKDFSIFAGEGEYGGYQCNMSKSLTKAELAEPAKNACKGIKPGDTIEVHWVHSSCDVKPGEGLGSCLSASCANPDLRVETQVFTVVNDPSANNFNDYSNSDKPVNGYYQAKSLPSKTGKPVQFMGSTTGPKYSEQQCSPLQVAWSVRPKCAKVDINSLSKWCESNAFKEDHPHGVRKLVVNTKLLSKIN